jgi:hypothetical protein
MNNEITICVNCKHCHIKEDEYGSTRKSIWDYQCMAHERMLGVNPVTGEHAYYDKNDLGKSYFTDEQYPDCKSINQGDCPKYEES